MKARIVESPFEALLHWLQTGKIDIIIGTLRPNPLSADITESPLFPDPYCLVARKDHPLCGLKNVVEDDLVRYEWILPRQDTPRRVAVDSLFQRFAISPTTIVETSSMALTRDLLISGDRLTLLSRDQIVFEDKLGLLAVVPYSLPTPTRVLGTITRSDWLPTDLQKNFLSIMEELAANFVRQGSMRGNR